MAVHALLSRPLVEALVLRLSGDTGFHTRPAATDARVELLSAAASVCYSAFHFGDCCQTTRSLALASSGNAWNSSRIKQSRMLESRFALATKLEFEDSTKLCVCNM
jgi:hypothetical protein